jgi:hypothetical protein
MLGRCSQTTNRSLTLDFHLKAAGLTGELSLSKIQKKGRHGGGGSMAALGTLPIARQSGEGGLDCRMSGRAGDVPFRTPAMIADLIYLVRGLWRFKDTED